MHLRLSYAALVIFHDERTQYSLISGVISGYIRGSGQASLDNLTIAAKCTLNMHESFFNNTSIRYLSIHLMPNFCQFGHLPNDNVCSLCSLPNW